MLGGLWLTNLRSMSMPKLESPAEGVVISKGKHTTSDLTTGARWYF